MKYLLDTCVISECVKPQPDENVISWLERQVEHELYLSVLTFGEIEKGIERAPVGKKKKRLRLWLEEDLMKRFEGRIIPVDLKVSIQWGQIQGQLEQAGQALPTVDGLIAASGLAYNCVVVTRNINDMKQSSEALLNPWLKESY